MVKRYLLVAGTKDMPIEPIVFIDNGGGRITGFSSSLKETDYWGRYIAAHNFQNLEQLATRFTYCSVEIGDLNDDVESLVNNLKETLEEQRYQGLVEAEQRQVIEQMPKVQSAVLRIGNRLRTGQNER